MIYLCLWIQRMSLLTATTKVLEVLDLKSLWSLYTPLQFEKLLNHTFDSHFNYAVSTWLHAKVHGVFLKSDQHVNGIVKSLYMVSIKVF